MKMLLLIALLFTTTQAPAQSLAQDIEQLELDYQKLSQLKQMLNDMYNAYTSIRQGYEKLKSTAEGSFNLHKAFLDALLAVSPVVRDYDKVTRIIDNEAELIKEYQAASRYFQNQPGLDYFNTMSGNLLNGSLRNLNELSLILTPGDLRMSDAERLSAIDRIDNDLSNELNYLRAFDSQHIILAGQRALDAHDGNTLRALYGLEK